MNAVLYGLRLTHCTNELLCESKILHHLRGLRYSIKNLALLKLVMIWALMLHQSAYLSVIIVSVNCDCNH